MSKIKKIIIGLIITVLVAGISVAVVTVLRNKNQEKKTANVFSVQEMMYTSDMIGDYNYLSGMVSVDKEQKIYLTSTDMIKEVCVQEGDTVKAGDVILVYDTTSQSLKLDAMRAQVEVARAAVVVAENDLEKLKNTTPVEKPAEPVVPEETPTEIPPLPPASIDEFSDSECATDTDAPSDVEPPVSEESPVAPDATVSIPVEGTEEDVGTEEPEEITYTAEELEEAIKAKQEEISRLTIDYQLMIIELQIMEYQYSTGEVICTFDGIVKTVADQETAILNNEPYIVVSGTDGYTVETAIGELDLMSVEIGDYVSLFCYDNSMFYYGTITEISEIPTNGYNYSAAEESFYPVTISIEDGEDLSRGMYMEITLEDNSYEYSDSFYIELAMVKKENANYYVMKEEDGKLVKSYVKTGEIVWGSMIEIKGGLNPDDYIAFPYSADAVEGVNAKQESIDVLYR